MTMMSVSKTPQSLCIPSPGMPGRSRGRPPSSPISPGSWEDSLMELSKGLHMICGSPKDISLPMTPTRLSPTSPVVTMAMQPCTVSTSPSCTFTSGRESGRKQGGHKVLIVRHEESSEKLQEQLRKICVPRSNSEPGPGTSRTRSSDASRSESIKSGFRLLVKLAPRDIDDVVVCVWQGKLYVYILKPEGHLKVSESEISPDIDLSKLKCVMCRDTLYIKEYSKTGISLDSNQDATVATYLPVFYDKPEINVYHLVFHVCGNAKPETTTVKTRDQKLLVYSRSPGGPAAEYTGLGQIRLSVDLPEYVDARSVTATMSHQKQLVVRGILLPQSRRYTY